MNLTAILTRAQATAESLMTDACTITRTAPASDLDEETGEYPDVVTEVYAGKCRVRSRGTMGVRRDGGEQFSIVNRALVSLPAGHSGFRTGDDVHINASLNPQIVNARYVVRSVDDQSHASALRLECEET